MNLDEKRNAYRLSRLISCALLVILYLAGLVFLMLGSLQLGLLLWVLSTVGGMGALWVIRNLEKAAAAQAEADAGDTSEE